ncbi:MAG: hypothetical protein NT027_08160, partial [Proteobacteria bacterium]|nr:hypothetical protein [Pseudomonadota bacterium]
KRYANSKKFREMYFAQKKYVTTSLLVLTMLSSTSANCEKSNLSFPTTTKAALVDHKNTYNPRPERGAHLHVVVTPPEKRGKEGKVLVEVYNRGKIHIASAAFDLTIANQGGLEIKSSIQATDVKPNYSGLQWISIPPIRGKFPIATAARLTNLRIVDTSAQEIQMKVFLDMVKR